MIARLTITSETSRNPFQLLDGKLQIWNRPVMPRGSFAVAVLYVKESGYPYRVSWNLRTLGLTSPAGYNFTEVFDGQHLGYFKPSDNFTCRVNPSGLYLIRATKLP